MRWSKRATALLQPRFCSAHHSHGAKVSPRTRPRSGTPPRRSFCSCQPCRAPALGDAEQCQPCQLLCQARPRAGLEDQGLASTSGGSRRTSTHPQDSLLGICAPRPQHPPPKQNRACDQRICPASLSPVLEPSLHSACSKARDYGERSPAQTQPAAGAARQGHAAPRVPGSSPAPAPAAEMR